MIELYTGADFCALDLPEPEWFLTDLIPGDGWTMVAALPKTGKSLFCLQVGDVIARGQGQVLGFQATAKVPRRVLFIQADCPPKTWQTQMRLICPETPMLITLAPEYVLEMPSERLKLMKLIGDAQPHIIIWDCLRKLSACDLNTQEGAQTAIRRIKGMAKDVPFIMIHHPRKVPPMTSDDIRQMGAGSLYLQADANATVALWWDIEKKVGKLARVSRVVRDLVMATDHGPHGEWILGSPPPKPPTGAQYQHLASLAGQHVKPS